MGRFVLLTGFLRNKPFIAALNRSNNFFLKSIFNWVLKLGLHFDGFISLWQVWKIRAILATNQMRTDQSPFLLSYFPALHRGCLVFNVEFYQAPFGIFLRSYGLLWLLWFWFSDTQSKSTLHISLAVFVNEGYCIGYWKYLSKCKLWWSKPIETGIIKIMKKKKNKNTTQQK